VFYQRAFRANAGINVSTQHETPARLTQIIAAVFQFTLTCSHGPIFISFVSVTTFLVALEALSSVAVYCDMEAGVYEVQEEDLPLKEIYQCDEDDLTKLCIRNLAAVRKKPPPRLPPDLYPLLPPPKQQ
jgi:hypothetical protein